MKKVLIVTYYWPPAGGPGVQRVLKFVKYLPEFGWKPFVLTVKHPDAPVYDESLAGDIPNEARIIKTKSLEPFGLYKKFTGKKPDEEIPNDVLIKKENVNFREKIARWVRANLFIPDAKIGWIPFAVKKGKEIVEKEKIDIIFSTSPPPTTAIIGMKLGMVTRIPWIADFRDPWLEIVYYQSLKRSRLALAIDSHLEKNTLNKSNALVTISKDMSDLFKSKAAGKEVYVIPNGFDETDFVKAEKSKNKKFTIAYTGSISKDRVPYPLFSALEKFKQEGIENILCRFAGRFANEFYSEIEKRGIENYFELLKFVPHNESTKILLHSDALLLVIDNVPENKGFLTGKMFEYLGCKKPVFAIGPPDGDANKILMKTDSGKMVDYNDDDGAYRLLKEYYGNWLEGKESFKFNSENYSRKKLTRKLADVFEKYCETKQE